MKTITVILLDIITILVCIKLINKFTNSRGIVSITPFSLLFFKEFLVYCFIGSSIIYLGGGKSHYEYSFMSNESMQFWVWISTLYAALLLFLTLYFLESISKRKTLNSVCTRTRSICKLKSKRTIATLILLFSSLSLMYYIAYCIRHGYFPVKSMFTMNSSQLSSMRFNDKFLSTENTIIKNFLLLTLPPITTYTAFYCYKKEPTIFWRLLLFVTFIVTSLCLTYRFEKSYLLYFFLGFILMPLFKNNKSVIPGIESKRSKLKKIIAIGLIVIFGMIYVLFVTGRDSFSIRNLYLSMNRFIYGQIVGLYRHYDFFPKTIDYMKFQFFPTSIANIFGNEEIRSARLVMINSYPDTFQGYMNSLFLGEAYANGGIASAILAPTIVGIMIYLEFSIFDMLKDNVFTRACLVYLCLNSIPITGGFLDFFYNPSFIMIFFLAIGVNFALTGKLVLYIQKNY